MTDNVIYPRGRPRSSLTSAERAERHKASVARSKAKVKNITIDADLVEILNDACARLEQQFGFRPTLSQALHYLLKQTVNTEK
jgi:3'-phosphoadenosine 5'-phosphosulfate sulfotransferase